MRRVHRRVRRDREIQAAVHGEIEALRDQLQTSLTSGLSLLGREMVVSRETEQWERSVHGTELTKALERVADALDGLGTHLQLDRRERTAQSMSVEFLLRELVVTLAEPVPDGPAMLERTPVLEGTAVLGGTIDCDATIDLTAPDDTLGPDEALGRDETLGVGSRVEVLSRFQRRWCAGFVVAEIVTDDRCAHYRLMRHFDRELLPVLFDAQDLRLVAVGDDETDAGVTPIGRS